MIQCDMILYDMMKYIYKKQYVVIYLSIVLADVILPEG